MYGWLAQMSKQQKAQKAKRTAKNNKDRTLTLGYSRIEGFRSGQELEATKGPRKLWWLYG